MNSNNLMSNLKYYGKYLIIIIIIFLLLKFVISLKFYESLLLSLIITVSILIIENIIYVNEITLDPLNCDQCKVNINKVNENNNSSENNKINLMNIVPNPLAETEQLIKHEIKDEIKEPFISDTLEKIINNVSEEININPNYSKKLSEIDKNMDDLKCVNINKNLSNQENKPTQISKVNQSEELENLKKKIEQLEKMQQMQNNNQNNSSNSENIEGFENVDTNELENFISNQQNQNKNLTNKLKSQPKIQTTQNQLNNKTAEITQIEQSLQNSYLERAGLLNNPKELDKINSQPKLNPDAEYNLDSPITYDAGYVQYQQDGLQKQENDVSFENALFKMGIGQENIVKPFMKDGSTYYNRIQSYSSKAPTPSESLNSELRYGDYNYISPLNKGMTNSDYTFISPNNWYPVPPHPPVCVTNKQCTTCPIMISDGQDYMNWATLEDFDKSRRFTGNMGINIDYVKNVLNNDEGY